MKAAVIRGAVFVVVLAGAYAAGRWHHRGLSDPGGTPAAVATSRPATSDQVTSQDAVELHRHFIYFDPETVELGEVLWGTRVPFSAFFVNETDEPITIETLSLACSCTVLDADAFRNLTVGPDDAVEISGVLAVPRRTGYHVEYLSITLDSHWRHNLNFLYTVVGTYSITPERIDFGTVDTSTLRQTPLTKTATFRATPVEVDSDVGRVALRQDIRPLTTDSAWLEAVAQPVDEEQARIVVTVDPDRLPEGYNVARLTVHTTDPERPRMALTVRVLARSTLKPLPSFAFLRGDAPATVTFSSLDGSQVKLRSVVAESSDIVTSMRESTVVVRKTGPLKRPTIVWVTDSVGRKARFFVSGID